MSEMIEQKPTVSVPAPKKLTSAGRLLRVLMASGAMEISQLAKWLGVSVGRLKACHDGERPLDVEAQIMLAALAMEIAPAHHQLARRLHAQAQSALRVREGFVPSQSSYPGRHW